MNEPIGIRSEWHIIRVCLKWKWPHLTAEDLRVEGHTDVTLLEILEARTGECREYLLETINSYRTALNLPRTGEHE